jgi:hypothetical protein
MGVLRHFGNPLVDEIVEGATIEMPGIGWVSTPSIDPGESPESRMASAPILVRRLRVVSPSTALAGGRSANPTIEAAPLSDIPNSSRCGIREMVVYRLQPYCLLCD